MIVRTLTETSTKEIMQIISILKEFESSLQHRPSRNYFRTLIVESQKKVKFLEDVLDKRAEKTKKPTVDVNKEIYCPVCRMTYNVPLTAVLSGSGHVKYFRDDHTKHVCPVCHEPEEEEKGGCRLASLYCDHCWHPSTGISSCFCCKCGGHK